MRWWITSVTTPVETDRTDSVEGWGSNNPLEGSVRVGSVAAGAWGQCAPASPLGRSRSAPQLHR
jgi:hypothetical protein